MTRANLLPRPSDKLRLFGIGIERGLAVALLSGAAAVSGTAAAAFGVETLAYARLQGEVDRALAAVSADAPVRTRAQQLALDVARYQEFAREMRIVRRSGPQSADAVVRVGNAVPPRVWLDALASNAGRIDLTGTAASLESMGGALAALARALPRSPATLVSLQRRGDASSTLRFAARLAPANGNPDGSEGSR